MLTLKQLKSDMESEVALSPENAGDYARKLKELQRRWDGLFLLLVGRRATVREETEKIGEELDYLVCALIKNL